MCPWGYMEAPDEASPGCGLGLGRELVPVLSPGLLVAQVSPAALAAGCKKSLPTRTAACPGCQGSQVSSFPAVAFSAVGCDLGLCTAVPL